ncbi:MAG TPA: hypothetical protein DEO65_09590 [Bacillus bacterium]|uniref:Uncharacterized protein n=1 Tax=Siminovitchia fordii TaxID=254759 RepID=A0ABQ4K333_9BACI|nr:hypothetical protein [Siminovitchia fordii]GIN19288.1 hypothetical protein J1TS3_04220 [Siminovitchia fordii]HBZ10114.1 hypothetical protein [Bacillus sp. (in: firmicutes)]
MNVIMIVFLIFGTLMLTGMLYNVILYQRPGIYPPKKVLKARAASLGGIGGILFTIGLLVALFSK